MSALEGRSPSKESLCGVFQAAKSPGTHQKCIRLCRQYERLRTIALHNAAQAANRTGCLAELIDSHRMAANV